MHHASSPKVFFTSFLPPPFFVSASSSLPPTQLESREQTNLAGSNNKKKQGKKNKLFSGLEDSLLSIFIWRQQSNLFSFYQEPNGTAMAPRVSFSEISPEANNGGRLAFLPDTQAPLNKNIKLIFHCASFQHQAADLISIFTR